MLNFAKHIHVIHFLLLLQINKALNSKRFTKLTLFQGLKRQFHKKICYCFLAFAILLVYLIENEPYSMLREDFLGSRYACHMLKFLVLFSFKIHINFMLIKKGVESYFK